MLFAFCCLVHSAVLEDDHERTFVSWMHATNQVFTGAEYQLRFSYFLENHRYMEQYNAKQSSFKLAHNKFSAYSPAERAALLGFRPNPDPVPAARGRPRVLNVQPERSWENSVSPVRCQLGGCCSDWAMVAVDAVESAWKISGHGLPCLSVEALLDCVMTCSGCKGGNVMFAYQWVLSQQNGFFAEENWYPAAGIPGCRWGAVRDPKVRISSTTQVFEGDEEDLANVISTFGPAAAAIDASRLSFMYYCEGIYDEPECSPLALNHAVLVVGYAKTYWLVKNSWGTEWGMGGYMRMTRGSGNQCGIATMALVPIC
jgi:cathepsin L